MQCANKEKNRKECNCTYDCHKKGLCCECVRYHRSKNSLPACYFSSEAEKTYNRSMDYFISIYQNLAH